MAAFGTGTFGLGTFGIGESGGGSSVAAPPAGVTLAAHAPAVSGSASVHAATAALTLSASPPAVSGGGTGSGPQTVDAVAASVTLTAYPPAVGTPSSSEAATDLSNEFDGRQRSGLGIVEVDVPLSTPPVDAPTGSFPGVPGSSVAVMRRDKAYAAPVPDLVDGRLT